ncbi:hypothetical protein AB0F43_18000 [Kribbella sp. NPDC023972]|uniref:hypothetical protein n=1 Tax=Kribbella sp. NPDC023972 TaxID=3154795 RepID=UPI0033EEE4B9
MVLAYLSLAVVADRVCLGAPARRCSGARACPWSRSKNEDPRTTKTIYVDVAEDLQHGAVDKLGFLFEQDDE